MCHFDNDIMLQNELTTNNAENANMYLEDLKKTREIKDFWSPTSYVCLWLN